MARKPSPNGPKPGPKPKIIDWVAVEQLASIGCRHEEIAATLGVSKDLLDARPEYPAIYAAGAAKGCGSIRRRQFQSAMAGSVPMLIWLGKVMLKQKEITGLELTGAGGGPIQHTDLSRFTDEQLTQFEVLLAIAVTQPAASTG